jgi:signal peptidase II
VSEVRREPIDAPLDAGGTGGARRAAAPVAAADPPRWGTFLGLAAIVAVVDQLTKAWLTSYLAPGQSVEVLGDVVRLWHSQNNGGLFGLFRGQAVVFGLASLVVVALIVIYHGRAGGGRYLSITLGLLLGGALGNLIDRLRIGYVVDFVDVGIGNLRWYTFNIADAAISFSLVLLVAASIWPRLARRPAVDG